ncbi:putative calcium-binding protein CML29 [Morus notabilis]|uniref:Putative calcium-binding protein CML29 n=1 Tax=Morus notabilis TaxID=981085 RepID=W9QVP1_9ROSA|nr:probable calcium-binding protein CML29 [Morus notabilis]EXB44326.1 putative calcium-binding protein CML29 [Morus notabilis]
MAQLSSISANTEALSHVLGLVEAFRAFDSDNDGAITAEELGGIMGSLGYNPTEQEVKAMMLEGDKNKDGLLSVEEFLEMNTKNLDLGGLGNYLMNASEVLNNNNNNNINDGTFEMVSGEELFQVLGSLGIELKLEDCQNIIASMDMDGDGFVSLDDFNLIVSSLL